MIVVRVELWSARTHQVTELARMSISNIGGANGLGDYETRTYRGRSRDDLDAAMLAGTVTRKGKVLEHHRLKEHVWNLVAKALTGMGYGRTVTKAT